MARWLALVLLMAFVACGGGSGSGDGRAECRAADVDPDLEPDAALPGPVAETEVAIVRAAGACDYDRLEELAEFDLGDPPLATLVELFEGPVVLDGDSYVWPGVEAGGARTAIGADGAWQYFTPADPSVLAATDDGRLVVLASDGTEQRELGAVGTADALHGFAVSSDGRYAYLDRGGAVACEARVVRLSLKTGRERKVATGAEPALSPDGRRLAYLGCQEGSDFSDQVVVRKLKSGKERRIDATGALLLARPSWAPDSRHLAVQASEATAQPIRVLDVEADEPYAESVAVQLESVDNTFWAGYRGATGEFYALTAPGGEAGAASPLPMIAIDADTGATLRTLFDLDAQCCVVALTADREGTKILAAGTNAGLVVWRDGDDAPQQLAAGVRVAAWVPAASGG